ncbi:restriction endonuclease subunit S [uncultured Sphingomonas sp.]|uniref:restriction endonuclease subunit S n=1 Tax=uncultured Sphingomonas sp. TaxID=158754 RepID=UPI0025CB8193|nr:restriction endonuclease subunit S [uncultured Sphingomonas sp.]
MAEWLDAQLSDLIDIKHGFAFKGEFFTNEPTGDVLVTPGNFAIGGGFQLNKPKFYNGPVPKEYVLNPGDVIVTMTDLSKQADTLGFSAVVPAIKPRLLHNQRIGRVIAKDASANLGFIAWLMRTRPYRHEIVGGATGSTVKHTSPGRILAHRFKLPSPTEQQDIVDVLQPLEDKIELNRRMSETLEGMAQAIFRDWFVDFGPTRRKAAGEADPVAIMGGLTPDPARAAQLAALFPAALGGDGLPVGWSKEPLLNQAHWINGAAYKNMHFVPKGMGLPIVKIVELKAGVSNKTKFTNTDLGQKYRINDGELLFSWSGNPDTSIDAFIWTGGEAWLNQHIFAVRENGKMDLPTLHTMLKWLMPQFAELARNKQTTGLGHVTKDDMKRLLVTEPPKPIAAAFSSFIGAIFERIVATLYENRTLAETRDYLLPRLMSGAVRVAPAVDAARL